jgi:signal transduction histidine kinase
VATHVTDADGLPANAVLAIAPSRAARNVLWLGTSFGVGIVDLARATQLPPARLTMRIVSEAQGRAVGQGDALGPGENDVHVDPMLLTFHREERTRFRVRLTGEAEWPSPAADVQNDPQEGEWLEVPNRYYHDLAPGNYVLTVWAYDWAGREYGPVQRNFSVLTPTWRSWPARIVYVLCGVLLLTVAYRWRVRTIRENALQLLASERRARDSERRFRAIFEQALDSHLLLEDGRIQAGNAEATRLFDVSNTEALEGRTLGELLGPEAERPGVTVAGETLVKTAHGDVPVQYTITEVPSADRMLRHAVVRDLTEVRKAEAERAWFQAQVREAQKLESLGTLAGGVAHDFNNLLGVIRGNAELARTALKRGRSNEDNLGAILDASDRARDIVRQSLTFSRRSTPTREYVNLSRLVLDLQPLLRRMIPRTVQLVIEGAEQSHLIMGDPTQLQQLLLNLVSNGEYAMRDTTNGLLTIALTARHVPDGHPAPTGDNVVLQVRDTGAGMTEEVRARIFEPFFTTKPTGEGTGLGMAVVHGIVTSHDARADVMSAPGQGTTFEIRFPQAVIAGLWDEDLDPTALLDDEVADLLEPPGVVEPLGGNGDVMDVLEDSPYAGTTIVVVDDEPAVAQVVERALQHYGHVVHVFNNPELALQFIQMQPSSVDLLITDQTMPGMTGDLLAESVHTLRADLPVLILTGFSHRLTPERIAAARAHAVMLKPVELDVLKQRVDEALALTLRR